MKLLRNPLVSHLTTPAHLNKDYQVEDHGAIVDEWSEKPARRAAEAIVFHEGPQLQTRCFVHSKQSIDYMYEHCGS